MEFYSHQQQQQQEQSSSIEGGVMSGSAAAISSAAASTLTTSSSSSSTPPTAIVAPLNSAPDAVTVDIAKNMLQLHRGGAPLNNNNNNNSSNNNNNNHAEAMSAPSTVVVHAAAANSSSSTSPLSTTAAAVNTTTHPPATQQASLSTNNNNTNSGSGGDGHAVTSSPPANALGYLKYDQELLYITDLITIIGRNSSSSHVHFHVAENNLVSRKHFQIVYDPDMREFYVQCLSKNGIFVDDFLHRRNAESLKLTDRCYFRFPSTEIRIQFESFLHGASNSNSSSVNTGSGALSYHNNNHHHHSSVGGGLSTSGNLTAVANSGAHVIISPAPQDDYHAQSSLQHGQQGHHHHQPQQQQQPPHAVVATNAATSGAHLLPVDSANVYSPLKISIPKKEQKSPYLSPTGTISAANSCPASPRQGFHPNQTNYNNYGNNNLQNQDLFQTPSTASYNHNEKPPYSYAQLIVQAISAAPDKQLTLSGIYSFIVKHYPYYRKETNKGWQNSIRHNLSLNRYFIKVARSQDEPGKGSFWRIDPDSGAKLIDHSYKKRRQRSSQGFRPSYGMPRSAPVSPSHMDNSRESSPLQDFVLQSAPGSPGMSLENRAVESADLMYNAPNVHQQAANNSHNQYNSPYFVSNQNSVIGISGPQQQQQQSHTDNSSVGALIALKRNHALAANTNMGHQQAVQQQQQASQQQQQPQPLHPDIIYEDMPTDYSGNMESGDECDPSKRPKYMSEVL